MFQNFGEPFDKTYGILQSKQHDMTHLYTVLKFTFQTYLLKLEIYNYLSVNELQIFILKLDICHGYKHIICTYNEKKVVLRFVLILNNTCLLKTVFRSFYIIFTYRKKEHIFLVILHVC